MDLHDALGDILSDLDAWLRLQSATGASVLPVEPLLRPDQRLPPVAPSAQSTRQRSAATPAQRPVPPRQPEPPTKPAWTRPEGPLRPASPDLSSSRSRDRNQPPPNQSAVSPAAPIGPPSRQFAPKPRAQTGLPLGQWADFVPGSASPVTTDDRSAAAATSDMVGLQAMLDGCTRCGLCADRKNVVFGVGSATPRLVVLGEGPGQLEDERGEPFVGPAGQMLDRMLQGVLGLARSDVYITNMVKCRPPRNRDPRPAELAACRPFLDHQLRHLKPEVVLVLGSVAAKALFDTNRGVTSLRGTWRQLEFPGGEARAMASFHPAYLLRKPDDKRLTFRDLKLVAEALAPGAKEPR